MRRLLAVLFVLAACGGSSSPEAVLEDWMRLGLTGDVEAAAVLVAPAVFWTGFGTSADVWVEGAGPFEAYNLDVDCSAVGDSATCTASWKDAWIDQMPDVERSSLTVTADVEEGQIRSFMQFDLDDLTSAAFNDQAGWLRTNRPEQWVSECGADPAAVTCSVLLIDTVGDWLEA